MTASPTDPSSAPVRPSDREAERLEALRTYDILDTPPEEAFDRITDLAAHLFDAPVAVINFIDDDRQWFKSCIGLDRTEVGLDVSFCARTVRSGDVLVVEDTTADPRFADDPLVVDAPAVRFYAGAPLVTPEGYGLGTICVFDTEPRSPSDATIRQLGTLADVVVDELELRRQASERTRTEEQVRRIVENAQPIVFMVDREGTFLLSEGRDLSALDLEPGEVVGTSVHEFLSDHPDATAVVDRALNDQTASDVVTVDDTTFDAWCAPFHNANGEVAGGVGMAVDVTERRQAQAELEQHRDRLRRTQDIANVGGWEYDLRTDTLTWTEQLYRIHERSPERGIDLDAAINYYTDEAQSTLRRVVEAGLQNGEGWEVELPIETETGARRWIRSIGKPQHDNGEVVKFTGAAQEVTERRAAEEALRESERRHREFMERSPVGIYRSTADGEFLYANDALVDMLGFDSFEALQAHNLSEEGFGLSHRDVLIEEFDEQGTVRQKETTWTGPDGTTVDLLESAHVIEEDGTRIYEGVVEDITERKRVERDLRRSRERLTNAQRIAKLGSWVHDLENEALYFSDQTRRIFGWDPDEPVTYEQFMASVHPEDRADLNETQERAIEEQVPIDIQYRVLRADTRDRIVYGRGEPTVREDGTVVRLSGTVLDVTERETAKQQLQETNQRLRLALEAADAGTFEYDATTGRSNWDARTLNIYGIDGDDRSADTPAFFSLVHPDDRDDLQARLEHVIENENRYEVSYRVVRPSGEVRHVLSSGFVQRADDGTPRRTIGLNQDVTERKEAEQELRRSRERWQRLVSAHRDPIQIAVDGIIRYINPAGAELFGASSPDEVIGRSVLEFTPDDGIRDALHERKQRLDRGEPTAPFEHEIERLDGERRIIESYSVPIEYDGEPAAQTVLRDVTEQREAERALRESKEELEEERRRLEMALVGGDLGLWDANLKTGEAVYDERWANMLGYSLDEVEENQAFFNSLVHPDDLPKVYDALQRQARGETDVMSVDIRMKAKDGSWRWIRDKGKVMEWDDDGEPLRAVGTHQDVTEEVRRREALRRSQKKYKSLFDASNEAIFIHDTDGQIRDVNSRARELFRYEEGKLPGQNVADLVPIDRTRAAQKLKELQEDGSVHSEDKYMRRDGSTFWGELSATTFATNGETLVQGMIRDVTDRKQAERARRESEARLRGLANSVPGIIFQFYARPDGEYGMHFVSEQAESVLGLATDLDGFFERFTERIDPSYREEFLASVDQAVENASFWNMEYPFCKPSGDTIWARGIATPEERDDDELIFNGVMLDITERKQLESQLRQAQKMETVGTLAGGIAHDFNNILHAATVYLRMGLEDLSESDPTYDFLSRAEKGLKRAESLVDKLLTFSRQEGKTVEETVNVAAVIEETLELVETSVPNHVEMRTAMDDACRVMGDPGQLQQVAMNLLTNAAQALKSQDNGSASVLDIDVRCTKVDEDLASRYLNLDAGQYVRLSISDTGPGMDQDTKERIFEPFFTTKDVGKGTGLGLSVVHGIVQAHEGEITVFTQPGEGTTFNVYIPHAGETANEDAEADDDDPPTGHVLFVDDDDQVIDLESVRLQSFGYEVTTRQNARSALEALDANPKAYDLILTDYAMPGMNGLAFMRELRDRGYGMPILLMSGFSAQVSEDDVLQAGAECFLRKPVGSSELEDAIDDALH